jgi:hypothetical protein
MQEVNCIVPSLPFFSESSLVRHSSEGLLDICGKNLSKLSSIYTSIFELRFLQFLSLPWPLKMNWSSITKIQVLGHTCNEKDQ